MARNHIPFYTAFQACVQACNLLATLETNEALKARMLGYFNRSYKVGYNVPINGTFWEDARTWAQMTPVDGLIGYDVLGDARDFTVWERDGRRCKDAGVVPFTTDVDGIRVTASPAPTTVWVSWMPMKPVFDTTPWAAATPYVVGNKRTVMATGECYRCVLEHTSASDFATDLAANRWVVMPVLEVMDEFLCNHMQGCYLKENGQPETGFKMMGQAVSDLRETHRDELRRNLAAKQNTEGTVC